MCGIISIYKWELLKLRCMEDKRVQGIKMKFFEQFKIGINRKSPDLEKEKDVPEAIRPYLADAQAGNSEAQYQLAKAYTESV